MRRYPNRCLLFERMIPSLCVLSMVTGVLHCDRSPHLSTIGYHKCWQTLRREACGLTATGSSSFHDRPNCPKLGLLLALRIWASMAHVKGVVPGRFVVTFQNALKTLVILVLPCWSAQVGSGRKLEVSDFAWMNMMSSCLAYALPYRAFQRRSLALTQRMGSMLAVCPAQVACRPSQQRANIVRLHTFPDPNRVHLAAFALSQRPFRIASAAFQSLSQPEITGRAFLSCVAAAGIAGPIVGIGYGFRRHIASVVQRNVSLSRGLDVVSPVYALTTMVYTCRSCVDTQACVEGFSQWSRPAVMRVLLIVSLGIAEEAKAYLLSCAFRSLRGAHRGPTECRVPFLVG
jgi:hypothetical protein